MRDHMRLMAIALGNVSLSLLLLPSPAEAQRYEVTGFIGYTTSGDIERTASVVDELEIAGGFTWGGQFGVFFGPHTGFEVSWAQQETKLRLTTPSGAARASCSASCAPEEKPMTPIRSGLIRNSLALWRINRAAR